MKKLKNAILVSILAVGPVVGRYTDEIAYIAHNKHLFSNFRLQKPDLQFKGSLPIDSRSKGGEGEKFASEFVQASLAKTGLRDINKYDFTYPIAGALGQFNTRAGVDLSFTAKMENGVECFFPIEVKTGKKSNCTPGNWKNDDITQGTKKYFDATADKIKSSNTEGAEKKSAKLRDLANSSCIISLLVCNIEAENEVKTEVYRILDKGIKTKL